MSNQSFADLIGNKPFRGIEYNTIIANDCEWPFPDSPAVIKTTKPQGAPSRMLKDLPDGIHIGSDLYSEYLKSFDPISKAFSSSPNITTSKVIPHDKYKTEADPSGKAPNEMGAKLDSGKVRPWLCISGFSNALEKVAEVTTIGAQKYTPNGWSMVENGSDRYMEAFGRHLLKLGKGEKFDDGEGGTGCLHKAQMIWNLLASLELDLRNEPN